MVLSPKREAFCQAYITEKGNASAAYRIAYDTSRSTDKTVWESASRLLTDPKVAARIAELQADTVARHNITVDDIVAMMVEDRDFARKLEAAAPAATSTMNLAKLLGYITDKKEVSGAVTVMSAPIDEDL